MLFINKGLLNLPTLSNFWKKGKNFEGGELVVEPDNSEEQYVAYTVGVYAREESQFSILYAPNFDEVIDVDCQELFNLPIGERTYFVKIHIPSPEYRIVLGSNEDMLKVKLFRLDDGDTLL